MPIFAGLAVRLGMMMTRLGPLLGFGARAGTRAAVRAAPAGSLRRRTIQFAAASAALGAGVEFGGRALPGGASFPGGDLPIQAGGGAFGGGGAFAPGGGMMIPQPGSQFGTAIVMKVWTTNPDTGFPIFASLSDGRIVVTKRNGMLKTYRPSKPIVISRNPRIRDIARAAKVLDRATSSMVKIKRQTARAAAKVK